MQRKRFQEFKHNGLRLACASLFAALALGTGCASTGASRNAQFTADHPLNRPVSRGQFNASLDRMLGI